MEKFVKPKTAASLVNVINTNGFAFYEDVFPPIGRIGITQYEHSNKDKEEYFKQVMRANKVRDAIFEQAGHNPFEQVKKTFSHALGTSVDVAKEQ